MAFVVNTILLYVLLLLFGLVFWLVTICPKMCAWTIYFLREKKYQAEMLLQRDQLERAIEMNHP